MSRSNRDTRASLDSLSRVLGHRFQNTELLQRALTHPSAGGVSRPDNQRLEFLGDRVLGLIIAEALIAAYPDEAEGTLAPRLNQLVRRETLAEVALEIGLGDHLFLGRSENVSGGRRKKAILADAMEAVIAALHQDGGIESARAFVLGRWRQRITAPVAAPLDAKTRLQEWAQARGLRPPEYRLIARSGPDHAPVFQIEAALETGETGAGEAASKKSAEQIAAAALLGGLAVKGRS